MSRHLSISIRLFTDHVPEGLCNALVSQERFQLASIGGIEGHETGDHWFLCGFALEDFLERFLSQSTPKPASIETLAASDGSNRAYLEETAGRLLTKHGGVSLSPFEKLCADAGTTFLDDHRIGSAETSRCMEWSRKFSGALLYFYGTPHLTPPANRPANAPWHRAFREVTALDQIDAPFLLVRVSASPFANGNLDVVLRTQSTVWLDGDANLACLVAIVEALVRSAEGLFVQAFLDLDGRVFLDNESRLRSAFSDGLGIALGRMY